MLDLRESVTLIFKSQGHRRHGRTRSSTATECSLDVSLGLFRCNVLTLVRLLPAFRHPDQEFCSTFLEVDLQGNQSGAFRILSLGQFTDLFPMSKKRPYSQGFVLPMRSRRGVFSHMHTVQPKPEGIKVRPDPPFREAGSAVSNGLHLRAQQSNTALKGVTDEVIVSGPAVFNDHSVRIGLFSPFSHRRTPH